MKGLFYLFLPLMFLSISSSSEISACKNGNYILERSIKHYDPEQKWQTNQLTLVIREPRTSVPDRFSNVNLDIAKGSFSLERNRGRHTSTHIIDNNGQAKTMLDNSVETDPELIKKYRLEPERNANYREYYRFMYGLPMILDTEGFTMQQVTETQFNGQKAISIDFELAATMISKKWRVFFSPKEYKVLGIATVKDQTMEGEYLVFNGSANIGGVIQPRFRHWYDKTNHAYLGSDILVSTQ